MAIQRWTIAKIGGASAEAVVQKFKHWHAASQAIDDDPDGQWNPSDLAAIQRFADTIRSHAMELPILFYSEHIDMWSVGTSLLMYLPSGEGVYGVNAEPVLACLDLRVANATSRVLHKLLETSDRNQEDQWFACSLRQAIKAWEKLSPEAAIVLIRQASGPSALDEQVIAANAKTADWLQ